MLDKCNVNFLPSSNHSHHHFCISLQFWNKRLFHSSLLQLQFHEIRNTRISASRSLQQSRVQKATRNWIETFEAQAHYQILFEKIWQMLESVSSLLTLITDSDAWFYNNTYLYFLQLTFDKSRGHYSKNQWQLQYSNLHSLPSSSPLHWNGANTDTSHDHRLLLLFCWFLRYFSMNILGWRHGFHMQILYPWFRTKVHYMVGKNPQKKWIILFRTFHKCLITCVKPTLL